MTAVLKGLERLPLLLDVDFVYHCQAVYVNEGAVVVVIIVRQSNVLLLLYSRSRYGFQ